MPLVNPIGSRQFSTRPAILSKYSTKMSTTNRSRPTACRPFYPASRRLLSAKNARIALAVFITASPTTARSLNGVRNSLLFAANPATKPCSVMLMSSLTLTRLPISGWRLWRILLRMTQQQPVLNVFKRFLHHASPPVLNILVPILKTTPNFASVISWTPIPSYYFFCYCLSLFCFKFVLIALLLVISSSMACAISSRETRKVRHP